MGLRFCILASSSAANCTYVASPDTAVLIDAGLSARETGRRLGDIGVDLDALQGICVSHEHSDHIAGLRTLGGRRGIPLYANAGTVEGIARQATYRDLKWNIFATGSPFRIGDLRIEPFAVAHDAYEPVGFVVAHGDVRIGIVTDMGIATELVRQRLKGCQALVVEANHDEDLLRDSRRPWPLKQRILGRQGHLSNRSAADLVGAIASPALCRVYLAHLSDDCNRPELAVSTMQKMLATRDAAHVTVELTYADRACEIHEI